MPPDKYDTMSDAERSRAVAYRRSQIAKQQREMAVGDLDPSVASARSQEASMASERFGAGTGVVGEETDPQWVTRGPTMGDVGGMAGSIAGGFTGARIGQAFGHPGIGAAIGSLYGAIGGGAAGEAAKQTYDSDSPFDTTAIVEESIRQGRYDLLGLGVNVSIRGGIRLVTGKPVLAAIAANEQITKLAKETAPELLQQGHSPETVKAVGDSWAMLSQKVDGGLLRHTEDAAAASAFAKKIPARRKAQDEAANLIVEHIRKKVGPLYDKAVVARKVMDKWQKIYTGRKDQLGKIYDLISDRMDTELLPAQTAEVSAFGIETPIGPATQLSGPVLSANRGAGRERVTLAPAQRIVKDTGSQAGMVDLKPIPNAIADTYKIIEELRENGTSIPAMEEVTTLLGKFPQGKVSFGLAKELRTHIADLEDELVINNVASGQRFGQAIRKPKKVMQLEKIRKALTGQMDQAVRDFDAALPAGKEKIGYTYFQANNDWANLSNLYGNAEMRGWLSVLEEQLAGPTVVDEFLQPQNIERLGLLVKGLEGTRELNYLRRWHLDSMSQRSMTEVGTKHHGKYKAFDPEKFLEILGDETHGFGLNSARVLHGETIDVLADISKKMHVIRPNVNRPRSFAMELTEAGPLLSVATGLGAGTAFGVPAGAAAAAGTLGTIAITVKGLNKLLTSPMTAKAILGLSTMSPYSGKAVALTGRILSALSKDDIRNIERGKRISLTDTQSRNTQITQ